MAHLVLLPVTATYAALLALLVVMLVLIVVKLRHSLRVGLGDGGNRDLARAIRVHANAVESVPLFLVLMALYELNGGPAWLLHLFGGLFFLARVLHAWGLLSSAGASPGRFIGTLGTYLGILGLVVVNLTRVLTA